MKLVFRRRALEQIDAAAIYYEHERAGLGARFEEAVLRAAAFVAALSA